MEKTLILCVWSIMLSSCTDGSNEFLNEISFLVQPHCEEEVRSYLNSYAVSDQYEAELIELSSIRGPYSQVKYVARLRSNFDAPSDDMRPYMGGATDECGTNSIMYFDTENEQEMANFVEILPIVKARNAGGPIVIELVDGELLIHEIYGK